jgi:hypothetical protein
MDRFEKEDGMNTTRWTLVGGLAFLLALPLSADESKTGAGLDRMKALAGQWEGKAANGKVVKATYKVVSGGSAVAETLESPGEPEMLSVYHSNGGELMMTHYCSIGNQPRMRADSAAADTKVLSFHFIDGTNMAGLSAPHMHDLKITFDDADHITEEWTMKGGPGEKDAFHLERKK